MHGDTVQISLLYAGQIDWQQKNDRKDNAKALALR